MNYQKAPIKFLLLILTHLIVGSSFSQLSITTLDSLSPEDLVKKICGAGIVYDNISFMGAAISSGIFTNGNSTNLGLDEGVFLTSGSGYLIPGPNNSNASVNNGVGGDATLNGMTTGTTYDAAVLEFDFVPQSDTLHMRFGFGSEEYSAGGSFTDVMGIFITGPNPIGGFYSSENIALVPGTDLPVNCNTINSTTNPEYFIDNTGGTSLKYDGFTTILSGYLPVTICETYHIKIGIADVNDYGFDSGIFLEENSFSSPTLEYTITPYPEGISENMVEGCVETIINFKLLKSDYVLQTLYWDLSESTANPNSFANGGDFLEAVPDSIYFGPGVDSVDLIINPVYDALAEVEEYLTFIVENDIGCFTTYDTVQLIIEDYNQMTSVISPPTITCEGCPVDLWVNVSGGFPPYSYLWEPGGLTSDTITVSPDTTTTYTVTYTDACQGFGQDTTMVTVFPDVDFESYYFEAALNPGLNEDVFGELLDDTVYVVFSQGTDLSDLIASFTLEGNYLMITVDGVSQESGITSNNFSSPVKYQILSPGGILSEWVVMADIETEVEQVEKADINIFPNPATEQLTISNASGCDLIIFNTLGIPVVEQQLLTNQFKLAIDDFDPGVYFVKIRKNGKENVQRIIVAK